MKLRIKHLFLLLAALLLISVIVTLAWYYSRLHEGRHLPIRMSVNEQADLLKKIRQRTSDVKTYARSHDLNTSLCFLVDMSIESGRNRFFVYDIQKDSVLDAGLVSHGCCNKTWLEGRRYSNGQGSGCTSLGHYRIGYPYAGRFGRAYKLYGLDSTNSNAFSRFVVLHSYYAVPEKEVAPLPICQSNGCPMVAPGFMTRLQPVLDKSSKPVLLWIYQ